MDLVYSCNYIRIFKFYFHFYFLKNLIILNEFLLNDFCLLPYLLPFLAFDPNTHTDIHTHLFSVFTLGFPIPKFYW